MTTMSFRVVNFKIYLTDKIIACLFLDRGKVNNENKNISFLGIDF